MSLESLVEDQMVDHALSARRDTGRCRRVGRLLRERVLDRHGERDRRRLYVAGLRSSAPQRDRPPLRKRSVPRSRNADFVGLATASRRDALRQRARAERENRYRQKQRLPRITYRRSPRWMDITAPSTTGDREQLGLSNCLGGEARVSEPGEGAYCCRGKLTG